MSNVEIKKTMVAPLEFIKENGNMSQANLEKFINEYCVPKSGAASTGPREVTILRDGEEIVGRKCTVTDKFFPIDRFAKNTSCIKEADGAKGKLYNESKKIEKDAQALLEEARGITDTAEKVAKFEQYDAEIQRAGEVRKTPVEIEDEWLEGSFDTIEELAASLNVVYPAPVEDTEEDVEDTEA